jgi:integrase
MDRFRDMLVERGLSASSIRQTQVAVKQVFEWATRQRLMQKVPLIETMIGKAKERGVLTPEEVKALFALPTWPKIHRAINMLAYSTGMRLGEILALRRAAFHVDEGYVDVGVSWDRATKTVKSTKTQKTRSIPVPTSVGTLLSEIMSGSTYQEPSDFFFSGRYRNQPLDRKMVERVLFKMFEEMGIDKTQRAARNITFHSARHFFNSLLLNRGIPDLKVKALTGHSTDKMMEHYYHPDDFKDVAVVSETLFTLC